MAAMPGRFLCGAAAGMALAALCGLFGEVDATAAAAASTAAAASSSKASEARAHGTGTETTEDDDGYSDVARAVLRQVPLSVQDDEDSAAMLSDRAFRAVVVSRVRAARAQHRVMKDFMKRFSKNLKLSVLEDSRGDMPEAERQAAIRSLKAGEDIHWDDHHPSPEQPMSLVSHHPQSSRRQPRVGSSWPTRHRGTPRMLNAAPPASLPLGQREPDEGADDEAFPQQMQQQQRERRALLTEFRRRPRSLEGREVVPVDSKVSDDDAGLSPMERSNFNAPQEDEDAPPPRWPGRPTWGRRTPPMLFAEGADTDVAKKPMKGWGNLFGSDRTNRDKKEGDKDGASRRTGGTGLPLWLAGLVSAASVLAATTAAAA